LKGKTAVTREKLRENCDRIMALPKGEGNNQRNNM